MRGRRPLPTALKILRGNPGKRALNPAEPAPAPQAPACPRHIQGEARHEWRRMAKALHRIGLLTIVDRAALAAYCQLWARWVKAEGEVARLGEVVKSPSGYPIHNPYLSVANTTLKLMHSYLTEFGMTPSARSRLALTPGPGVDATEEKLFGYRSGT